MRSLQSLCCTQICLNPEKTFPYGLDELNLPCLDQVVRHMSMFDLLKYEQNLQKRGIDTDAAISRCQKELQMPSFNCHMGSTVCPRLLETSRHDRRNWGLSRELYRNVIGRVLEESHRSQPALPCSFTSDAQQKMVRSNERILKLLCPTDCTDEEMHRRAMSLPEDALRELMTWVATKIFSVTADLKFCNFFTNPDFKPVLNIFLDSLQILSIVLKSSALFLSFIKMFKKQAKSLRKIGMYVIRNNDLQYLDEILSACSGVVGFHKTARGNKDKAVLETKLSALREPEKNKEDHRSFQDFPEDEVEISNGHYPYKIYETESEEADCVAAVGTCASANAEFDLMDDAVLFGTASPPSRMDSNEGVAAADFKFTNLVDSDLYVAVLDHHLTFWLALRELHLGVPDITPTTIHGLTCLLKRPQFKSLALSSAVIAFKDMEHILTTVASCRNSHPLERLMLVSLSSKFTGSAYVMVEEDINMSEEQRKILIQSSNIESLAKYGQFQGAQLFEAYHCVFDLQTGLLVKQFVTQDLALRTLCLSNSLGRASVGAALTDLASAGEGHSLSCLILEDWQVNSPSTCDILKAVLTKMAATLTSLGLKGCLTDRSSYNTSEIVESISACTNLQTLDLSENNLGNDTVDFAGTVMKHTQLKELSLKANRLPAATVTQTMAALYEAAKHRGSRLEVLDMKGNKFVEDDQASQVKLEAIIRTLQQTVADKIICDMDR